MCVHCCSVIFLLRHPQNMFFALRLINKGHSIYAVTLRVKGTIPVPLVESGDPCGTNQALRRIKRRRSTSFLSMSLDFLAIAPLPFFSSRLGLGCTHRQWGRPIKKSNPPKCIPGGPHCDPPPSSSSTPPQYWKEASMPRAILLVSRMI